MRRHAVLYGAALLSACANPLTRPYSEMCLYVLETQRPPRALPPARPRVRLVQSVLAAAGAEGRGLVRRLSGKVRTIDFRNEFFAPGRHGGRCAAQLLCRGWAIQRSSQCRRPLTRSFGTRNGSGRALRRRLGLARSCGAGPPGGVAIRARAETAAGCRARRLRPALGHAGARSSVSLPPACCQVFCRAC